jgi:hypothetical protein
MIKFWGGNFLDRSWMFVCSRRSISCITLGGQQLDLGPVEAVEGRNNAKSGDVGKIMACDTFQKWHEKIG